MTGWVPWSSIPPQGLTPFGGEYRLNPSSTAKTRITTSKVKLTALSPLSFTNPPLPSRLVPDGIPNEPPLGITDGHLTVTLADLCKVFDPVIDAIMRLITQQADAVAAQSPGDKIAAVLLVGGFGSNAYLKQQVEQKMGAAVAVNQPPEA
jgi:Tfp pilus assembly PilM family ATPase